MCLVERLLPGPTADLGFKVGQREALERDNLARDAGDGGGPVHERAPVVDHIHDGAQLARVLSIVNQDDAADLDESGKAHGAAVCVSDEWRRAGFPFFPLFSPSKVCCPTVNMIQ